MTSRMNVLFGFILCQTFFVGTAMAVDTGPTITQIDRKVTIEIDGGFPALPTTDVLFVVDNSGSMDVHQKKLAAQMDLFIDEATRTHNDFHLSVMSSSMKDGGHFQGNVKVITPQTPILPIRLRENLLLGTYGDATEVFFSPVLAGLSDPLLTGHNSDFLRPDAELAVVLVTDTDDQSNFTAWEFADFLVDLKGDSRRVAFQALVRPDIDSGCEPSVAGEVLPTKITEVSRLLDGDIYNLCADAKSYAKNIKSISRRIFSRVPVVDYKPGVDLSFIDLVGQPLAATIQVRFGTQFLMRDEATGWQYDAKTNAILFGKGIEWAPQSAGTPISIEYQVQ